MTDNELRELATKSNIRKQEERPIELRNDLLKLMESFAKQGSFHLDFLFKDDEIVVNKVIALLKTKGIRIGKSPGGNVVRFEW